MDFFYWGAFHVICLSSLGLSGLALYRTFPRPVADKPGRRKKG